MTNTEFISRLMDFSKSGPLMQLFIIEAVRKHSERVVNNADKVREQMEGGFVSPDAWIAAAQEALDRMNEHLGK